MKYYTEIIPATLAEKLKEKGMPITYSKHPHQVAPNVRGIVLGNFEEIDCPSYAEVFDWLMEKGLSCEITRHIDFAYEEICPEWDWDIEKVGTLCDCPQGYGNTWHEAANSAIENAITLI